MDRKEAIDLCYCRMCASYVECEEDVAFCLTEAGHSKCIEREKGCICPGCPVQDQMELKHAYYCIRGSEREILTKG